MHGCIDGFSRVVVYLECNTDNTSATVLDLFKEAVAVWGLPSRVRGDMGVENRDVARFMLAHEARGPGRGSYITGRSVHNSRIESLWRDVYQSVLSVFTTFSWTWNLIAFLTLITRINCFVFTNCINLPSIICCVNFAIRG